MTNTLFERICACIYTLYLKEFVHVYITDCNFHKLIFLPRLGLVLHFACMNEMESEYKFCSSS